MSKLVKHCAPKGKRNLLKISDMSDQELEQFVAKTPPKELILLLLQIIRDTRKS